MTSLSSGSFGVRPSGFSMGPGGPGGGYPTIISPSRPEFSTRLRRRIQDTLERKAGDLAERGIDELAGVVGLGPDERGPDHTGQADAVDEAPSFGSGFSRIINQKRENWPDDFRRAVDAAKGAGKVKSRSGPQGTVTFGDNPPEPHPLLALGVVALIGAASLWL